LILDSLTIDVLALELSTRHQGQHIRGARADEAGLEVLLETNLDGGSGGTCLLRLEYGPPGSLSLTWAERIHAGEGPERYLQGARIESIAAVAGERMLSLSLSRKDAEARLTHGLFHLFLFPPRYRAVLVSGGHGRILGVWAGAPDRRAPAHGSHYEAPSSASDRLVPGPDACEAFALRLQRHDGSVELALRQILSGADRHLVARLCADSGLDPAAAAGDVGVDGATAVWTAARRLWSVKRGPAYRWIHGPTRVSVAAPAYLEVEPAQFPTVCEALVGRDTDSSAVADTEGRQQRRRLERGLHTLERRAQGLQADLDEAQDAGTMERAGNSLMAAADSIAPGGRGRVPDAHDENGVATIEVRLAPGETPARHAARLLRRAAKLRRRAEILPPRLHHVRELIFETERLLDLRRDEDAIPEEMMKRWERRVEVRQTQAREGALGDRRQDDRQGAHPRRYLTSSGWSVWAGRNNRENDIVTHRLAAQNDVWFHAHGYAGSHVILRREGRKEEPSNRTLEEAAAVAAYWSKGRTANKVPVVYTLAKYVSKPRGGVPGLAVMKREKTIMVRPALLAEEAE
jgi:predicted ribosome quality control (RQC) complex YloA/Tae2 family protein